MAETNGSGRPDRIDATLDKLAKQLITWQVLMQDKMDKEREDAARERTRLDQLWENTDKRVADLVTAIGRLIQK